MIITWSTLSFIIVKPSQTLSTITIISTGRAIRNTLNTILSLWKVSGFAFSTFTTGTLSAISVTFNTFLSRGIVSSHTFLTSCIITFITINHAGITSSSRLINITIL